MLVFMLQEDVNLDGLHRFRKSAAAPVPLTARVSAAVCFQIADFY